MDTNLQLIECVPNFSEGRNLETINAIANEIKKVNNVKLLHIDIGFDANRTVFTFVGNPKNVIEAAFNAIKIASQLIDMQQHKGTHPRMGACDVCPLIPVQNITLDEVVEYSHQLAKNIANLDIPVYMYEHSTNIEHRKKLEQIRSGEYEKLEQKMQLHNWQPNYGKFFNKKFGAVVIGARNFLIAYNINLKTTDITIAKNIAKQIRTSGYIDGNKNRINGIFKNLKAIGWLVDELQCTQVSTNITNTETTKIKEVFDAITILAIQNNTIVNGSELIGLIPKNVLIECGKTINKIEQNDIKLIEIAIQYLGLNTFGKFNYKERILEYLL